MNIESNEEQIRNKEFVEMLFWKYVSDDLNRLRFVWRIIGHMCVYPTRSQGTHTK